MIKPVRVLCRCKTDNDTSRPQHELLPSRDFQAPQIFSFQVLWPSLLQCVVPEPFTNAMTPLCRSLSDITSKKREEEAADFLIDFEVKSESRSDLVALVNSVRQSASMEHSCLEDGLSLGGTRGK